MSSTNYDSYLRLRHAHRLLLTCLLFIGIGVPFAVSQVPSDLATVSQIRDLRPEQAALERPVRLRGVVTAISGWKSSFFFQDDTAGISVDRLEGGPELHPGEQVEVVGVTAPGKFAPIIRAESVKVLGVGTMPPAKIVGPAALSKGTLDGQWATIQGVVHRAEIKQIWGKNVLVLQVDIGESTLVTVRVRAFAKDAWRRLPASVVSLRGVCGTVFNDKRQFIALRMFVSSLDDVTVLHPGPEDLFDRRLTELSGIDRFRPGGNGIDLVRIRGVVTFLQGADRVYVQNGTEAVLVESNHEDVPLRQGSEVEVVGYAHDRDYSPYLEGAAFRLVKPDLTPIVPVQIKAADAIVEKDGFVSSPYDASLIRVRGVLKQMVPGTEEAVLFLQDGTTVFTARLPNSEVAHGIPAIGSLVDVTGVCGTRVDTAHDPRGFRVLLRSASDIALIEAAPWWTAEHAKTVVIIMAAAMLVMLLVLFLYQRESNLRHLSLSDPLTGLHNRRGFVLLAEQQWRLALRRKVSMLVFYIDLDKFKEINDELGHKQGDIALQMVAGILRECFRKSDVIGRLGGDEFAIVACDAASTSQVELEERLSGLVQQSNRELAGAFQISLSVGAVLCDASMSHLSIDDLLSRSDALMYEQKMGRRETAHASSSAVTAM